MSSIRKTTGRLTLAQTLAGMDQLAAAEELYKAILGYDAGNARAYAVSARRSPRSALRRRSTIARRHFRSGSAEGWAG
jgi:hypothetical protein